jgi:membrane-bound serine protease (ClpP class)
VEQDDEPRRLLRSLVVRVGQARSRMLPSGAVLVDGHVIDALSEGLAIEPGAWVKVVAVRGMQVVVRPTEERPGQASRPAPVREPAGGDLDRSLQELGLDDLPVPPPPEETDGTTGVR